MTDRQGCDMCSDPENERWGEHQLCGVCTSEIRRTKAPFTRSLRCKFCAGSGKGLSGAPCFKCKGEGRYDVTFSDEPDEPDVLRDITEARRDYEAQVG